MIRKNHGKHRIIHLEAVRPYKDMCMGHIRNVLVKYNTYKSLADSIEFLYYSKYLCILFNYIYIKFLSLFIFYHM